MTGRSGPPAVPAPVAQAHNATKGPRPVPRASTVSVATFLFTDIEGSTRLWEHDAARMRDALARHDALSADAVTRHHGRIVKRTGDGLHAVFDDPLHAVQAVAALQLAMAPPHPVNGLQLHLRCGLHSGDSQARDGDFFGPVLNRAARVMSVAHGGQVLLTAAVASHVADRLPAPLALRDLGRVRLRDLASPEQVHQLLHPALRADYPALRSLEATPNNLAQQISSFVGREHALAQAHALLQRHRLVTLLGMGGIGKSRLSVQLGAERLDEHPDGVWLVELAPLTDPRRVPQAVASVLGVTEDGDHDLEGALRAWVQDKRLLLILDNCEHVRDAAAALARQLLQAAAGLRVLASSRDALGLAGEATYAVPALGVPAAANPTAPRPDEGALERLARHEAVRLFVDRASAASSGFALTADNAAAVAEICRRLDGIPLALELAAARVRSLSPQALASRLADRFALLVSRDQTVLPRQRTLRALIDWSHDLLSTPERMLFRRLAVLAGGWTLELAESVCSGDGLAPADVLDLQARLVEKSLVEMEADGTRYRMLETVRAYAAEQLQASGDEAGVRGRHLLACVALAESARPWLSGPEQGRWLTRLDQERENLLQAHAWCAQRPDDGAACNLRLAYALRRYWLNRGLPGLGLQVTVEALSRPARGLDPQLRFNGLMDAGWLAYFMGRYGESRAWLGQALDLAREQQRADWAGRALQPLGMACLGDGDVPAARQALEQGVQAARLHGQARETVAALNGLAQLHRSQGELDQAQALYQQALVLARDEGDAEHLAALLLNLAMVSMHSQPLAHSCAQLHEVLDLVASTGSRPALQAAFDVCAGLAVLQADSEAAGRFHGAAEALAAQTGLKRDPADEAFVAPLIERARQADGGRPFEVGLALGQAWPVDEASSAARQWLQQARRLRAA